MNIIVLDAETYYSDDYTLSKMSTEAYVRDPRFEDHGWAWMMNGVVGWLTAEQFFNWKNKIDWPQVAILCHHAQFDGLILSHRYGIKPKFWFDTLSMARLLLGNHLGVGLDALARHFNLQAKTVPYNLFRGRHWNELTPAVQQQVANGACHDVELTWQLFQILAKDFPREEYQVIDTVIRMFTEPVLRADVDMLGKIWEDEARKKQTALTSLDVTEADLQSADRFAALLRECGIEPEMKDGKVSEKTGKSKRNYAFAKTDDFMRDLLEHDDERVRTLAETRLGVKSTIMQTRAETLGFMAGRGPLPVYLRMYGAGTLRVSGGDGANWLNFKRRSPIRRSILAPPGYLLGPVDSSQIECRVLHYLAGGPDEPVIKKFRNKEDPYVDLASLFYREPIYKPKAGDPRYDEMDAKRGMGKQGRLMCLGPETLVLTNNGIKPIIEVQANDRLWDGSEWVAHQGLLYQGHRYASEFLGCQMTYDHLVWCGVWMPAIHLRNANIRRLALANGSANLPSSVMKSVQWAVCDLLSSGVHVERQNIPFFQKICAAVVPLAALFAPSVLRDIGSKIIGDMKKYARTPFTAAGCSEELERYLQDVIQKKDQNGMLVAAYLSTNLGEEIGNCFLNIYSNSLAGTIRFWIWIGKTTIKDISREIYNLLRELQTQRIAELWSRSKIKLPTYDLACAGPKNRFTILSSAGALIVHNCGYGAAGKQFKETAKNGLYGPPVDIPIEDAHAFVKLYRDTNPSICERNTGYWAQAGKMLARLAGGPAVEWGPLTVKDHRIYLPNGCALIYDTLEYFQPPPEDLHLYREYEQGGFWRVRTRHGWKTMWGSKLVQNICEAVSRVIVSQAMNRITAMGYRVLNWPYDELLLLIPADGREQEHLERCRQEMIKPVAWLPGLPLDAEASLGERYSK